METGTTNYSDKGEFIMPFQVSWYVEKRIIYGRYYGEITLEELTEATDIIYDYLEETEAPAYLIADTTDVTRHPYSLAALRQALRKERHPNLAWSLGVTSNKMVRMMSGMLNQMARMQAKHFTKLEEALEFLQRLDSTLPDLSQKPPIPYTANQQS